MGSIEVTASPLAPLASKLHLSPTLEINELVQKRLKSGRKVVHLGFGEATFPVHRDVLKAHEQASRLTSYLPVAGLKELRESIARSQGRRLGTTILPEQVVVAPGSKPLLFALFALLDGDVLLPRPSWVSYEPQVMLAGKNLFWVETDEKDRHTISDSALADAFDKAIESGSNPKVMLINNPSNPTGQAFSTKTMDTIVNFCRSRSATLISDEIYSDLCFESQYGTSPCRGSNLNSGQMIMTGGLSKTYSAGGWRVGFAIFPQNDFGDTVKQAVLSYASECWSAASAPAQIAATVAFDTTPELDAYRTQVARLHGLCANKMFECLTDLGLDVAKPKGAFYLYPSFSPYSRQLLRLGIKTSKQLSTWLIEDCGIAALPGSVFGEDDAGLPGGRYRLRMATSYLFFNSVEERYTLGYDMLASSSAGDNSLNLSRLDEAIAALQSAVSKLKAL